MRSGKLMCGKNVRQSAAGGLRAAWVPNISPYKDGANPLSDANSFPSTGKLDSAESNPTVKTEIN
jgi:hypothetical protein